MQTIEYHLYRVKFIKPSQLQLFSVKASPKEIFEAGLKERPSIEKRKNSVWHIGNLEYITDTGGRFAIGRTTKTTIEKFDNTSRNFIEHIDDSGPYTYVYFDSYIGLLGIAKKSKVASDVKSIAKKIQLILANTRLALESKVEVRVDFIPDPQDFIQKLHEAYAIKKFSAHFTGPNPIDADELFQRPLSYYCQQLEGERGSVEVTGEALNKESVEAIAKSTAATGNPASAYIQTEKATRPIRISFEGDAVKITIEQNQDSADILAHILETYQKIRK